MLEKLTGPQQQTYDSIFHQPHSRNVQWDNLCSMFRAMGKVVEDEHGNLTVSRNGHTLGVQAPASGEEGDIASLMEIRHFLRTSTSVNDRQVKDGQHLLVVIDHHEARIFKSQLSGSAPEKIVLHDPHGFGQHVHNIHDHAKGQHHPVPSSFFESVAKSLQGASQILMFGAGTGGGSAMNELLAYLHKKHKDLYDRVMAARTVDATHLTENELLAKARDFYESVHGCVKSETGPASLR